MLIVAFSVECLDLFCEEVDIATLIPDLPGILICTINTKCALRDVFEFVEVFIGGSIFLTDLDNSAANAVDVDRPRIILAPASIRSIDGIGVVVVKFN